MIPASTPDEALEIAYRLKGEQARVVVIPDGVSVLTVKGISLRQMPKARSRARSGPFRLMCFLHSRCNRVHELGAGQGLRLALVQAARSPVMLTACDGVQRGLFQPVGKGAQVAGFRPARRACAARPSRRRWSPPGWWRSPRPSDSGNNAGSRCRGPPRTHSCRRAIPARWSSWPDEPKAVATMSLITSPS